MTRFKKGTLVVIDYPSYKDVRGIIKERIHGGPFGCSGDDNDGCCWIVELLDYDGRIMDIDQNSDIEPPLMRINEAWLKEDPENGYRGAWCDRPVGSHASDCMVPHD